MKLLVIIVLSIFSLFGIGLMGVGALYSIYSMKTSWSSEIYFVYNLNRAFYMLAGAGFALCVSCVCLNWLSAKHKMEVTIRKKTMFFIIFVLGVFCIVVGGYLALGRLNDLIRWQSESSQIVNLLTSIVVKHFFIGVGCLWVAYSGNKQLKNSIE